MNRDDIDLIDRQILDSLRVIADRSQSVRTLLGIIGTSERNAMHVHACARLILHDPAKLEMILGEPAKLNSPQVLSPDDAYVHKHF